MGHKPLLHICFIFLFIQGYGQNWRMDRIGNADGLSNSAVTTVYMDSEDFIWLGTWDGLNRYDGSNIKVFKPEAFKEGSISNNIIRNILEDKQQNLWIVTEDGVNLYNDSSETFRTYLTTDSSEKYMENRYHAFLDPDSSVWCNKYGDGIRSFNYSSGNFSEPIRVKGHPGFLQKVKGAWFVDNLLWILKSNGTLYGLSQNEYWRIELRIHLPDSIKYDYEHHWFFRQMEAPLFFIATQQGGLLSLDLNSENYRSYNVDTTVFRITSLSKSKNGNYLWGGTDGGHIFKFHPNRKRPFQLVHKPLKQLRNKQLKIWTIVETDPDLLWIGTDGDGVYKYIMKDNHFHSVGKGPLNKGQISHNVVRAIYEDSTGNLWVGTRGDGLNFINKQSGTTTVYNTRRGLTNNAVLSLEEDKYGNIWMGLDGEGMDMYERSTGNILHFPEDFTNNRPLDIGLVYAIMEGRQGDLWIGTSGYGLFRLSVKKTGNGQYRLQNYSRYHTGMKEGAVLQSNIIYSVVETKPGVIWFGTRGAGLYRLQKETGKLKAFQNNPGNRNSLNNNDVLSLWKGSENVLWIGTSGGLNRLELKNNTHRFTHYIEPDMPNNTIHSILGDSDGYIWLSTNNGLVKLNPSDSTVRTFYKSDGLQNNEFTDGTACVGQHSGMFYFGGVDGFDKFYPDSVRDSDYSPRLAITDFKLLVPGETGITFPKGNIDMHENIELQYNQNYFKIAFTTLNYHNKQKCRYAYSLQNAEKEKIIKGKGNEATFTNLQPGKYKFRIKWTNEDGIWNQHARTLGIIIHPPFWKTSWAYAVYGILIIGMLILFAYIIKRRMQIRHNLKMERMKMQKIEEMNQYKLRFFTNIAHEFRTPLTLIMAPAAKIMEHKNKYPALMPYLHSIYSNATRLLHLISELIDFRKVETGHFKLKVKYDNFSAFLKSLTDAFEHYAQEKSVTITFDTPREAAMGWFDAHIMEKVFLNLISNAIKYSYKHGSVIVRLDFQGHYARVSVSDKGEGIEEAYQEKIFNRFYHQKHPERHEEEMADSSGVGLSLTKSLVELHKGTIKLQSAKNQGSTFSVVFPFSETFYTEDEKTGDTVIDELQLHKHASEKFIASDYVDFNTSMPASDDEQKETVLVVDDNEKILNLIADILQPDYAVLKALNGTKALDIMNSQEVNIVISDIIMDEMDGLTLTEKIKEDWRTCHIPVILLTAKGELENRIQGIASGADSYIPKPFDPRHLKVRVRKLIEGRNKIRETFQSTTPSMQPPLNQLHDTDARIVKALYEYVEQHIEDENLNADNLAMHLNMGRTLLYLKVKALTGFTPHGFIKNLRIKKAADLLLNSDLNVSEIIYKTGFKNRTYFYRSFKELFGTSPLEYISQINQE